MSITDHVPCKFVSCAICGPALASARLDETLDKIHNEDVSWMTLEDAIAHYQSAMANWNIALDERDKLQKECSELRELLVFKASDDQISNAVIGCPECGETMTSRLGTELKIQRDQVRTELAQEREDRHRLVSQLAAERESRKQAEESLDFENRAHEETRQKLIAEIEAHAATRRLTDALVHAINKVSERRFSKSERPR
jgi:predicted  nucleic acid-binding Zn-ribbon protein